MTIALWTLVIAVVTAVTCAICGVFLVVKREALVCEGLSHAVLPGIIIAFILFRDRNSPLLILSAALMGLLMVLLVQLLGRTRMVDGDASLGIVFSALFSVGIILASQHLRNTHFHAHCIIDGNLALSPLDTIKVFETKIPKSFVVMSAVFATVCLFITVFYKELKLMLFDASLAKSLGFKPALMHIVWLAIVSITTVSAFETAGSILVVALMIAPPAAAYLLTSDLRLMFCVSALIGIASAIIGFCWGYYLDISPTGPMSTVSGILFLLTLFLAPRQGLISKWNRRRRQRIKLFENLLLDRFVDDPIRQANDSRSSELHHSFESLCLALAWPKQRLESVLKKVSKMNFVREQNGKYLLTEEGMRQREKHKQMLEF